MLGGAATRGAGDGSATNPGAAVPQRRRIFIPARGQYSNVGDILLRRELLDWARESGALHVYLGWSPPGYAEGLRLQTDDVQYRSFLHWYGVALCHAVRGSASYVFKPGEIQLTIAGMKEHLSMLPVIALIRARGGAVARIGVGSRNFAPLPRALIWPSIALSNLSVWRDAETARYLGRGEVMPDLAFGPTVAPASDTEFASQGRQPARDVTGDASEHAAADRAHPDPHVSAHTMTAMAPDSAGEGRHLLVISLRSDLGERPDPGGEWITAVDTFARAHGLQVCFVTQVEVDDDRNERLAGLLGADFLGWDGGDHHLQEVRLRAVYRNAAMVISDRLHVLVAGITEGAVPGALLLDRSDKIDRHFVAAGMPGISLWADGLPADEILEYLESTLARREELLTQLRTARRELHDIRERLRIVLAAARAK